MAKLTSEELYELKKAMLEAQKATLRAQAMEAETQSIVLALSEKYGQSPLKIDFNTGEIVEEKAEEKPKGK